MVLFQATYFSKCTISLSLFDSWRTNHPTHRQFTFYSVGQKMYSSLDHFFISDPLILHTVDSNLPSITCPCPNFFSYYSVAKTCHWLLNDHLLQSSVTRGTQAKVLRNSRLKKDIASLKTSLLADLK